MTLDANTQVCPSGQPTRCTSHQPVNGMLTRLRPITNQTNTNGVWFGHGGYGGQYLVANPESGRVAAFLSVLDDENGYESGYYPPIISMLSDICAAG